MLASDLIVKLQDLVKEHGDRDVWHEDSECVGYTMSGVFYNKKEDDFQIR